MIYKINIESVYCLGDIHGSLKGIASHIKRYGLKNCALIFCGDIGFGFEKIEYYEQIYRKLHPLLSKNNIYCYFVRGNHDNPDLFDGKKISHKRFVAIEDYSVIQSFSMEDRHFSAPINTILCVGGAISIDRSWRKEKMYELAMKYKRFHACDTDYAIKHSQKLYWENEPPYFDKKALLAYHEADLRINAVCTHTCPSFCEPLSKDGIATFLTRDFSLAEDIDVEREVMTNLWHKLRHDGHPLHTWCYGHYHYHHRAEFEGVRFVMLDMERNGIYDMIEIVPDTMQ